MTRTGKRIAITAAVLVGLLLVAVALVSLLLPKDLIRRTVAAKLEQKLERPVSIASVSARALPFPRVELKDLSIGTAPEPGRPQIEVPSLTLRLRLMPLLRRRVEIVKLDLEGPTISMYRGGAEAAAASSGAGQPPGSAPGARGAGPSGRGTGPGGAGTAPGAAGRPGEGEAGKPEAQAPGVDIQVEDLTIHDGRLTILNPDGSSYVDLSGLSERLSAEATSGGDLRLEGTTEVEDLEIHLPAGTLGRGIHWRLKKKLDYTAADDRLRIEEASLEMGSLPVALKGEIRETKGEARANLSLEGGPAEVQSILGYLPSHLFPELDGVESEGVISVHASVEGPLVPPGKSGVRPTSDRLDYRVDLALSGGRIVHPRLPAPIEDIALQLQATPDRIEIPDLRARSGDNRVQLAATVSDYQTVPWARVAVETDLRLDEIAPLYVPEDSLKLGGRVTANVTAEGPADRPEKWSANGTADLSAIRVESPMLRAPIEDLGGHVVLRGDEMTLQKISARMGSSDFAIDGTIRDYRALVAASTATSESTRPPTPAPTPTSTASRPANSTSTETPPGASTGSAPGTPASSETSPGSSASSETSTGSSSPSSGQVARFQLGLQSRRLDLDELMPPPQGKAAAASSARPASEKKGELPATGQTKEVPASGEAKGAPSSGETKGAPPPGETKGAPAPGESTEEPAAGKTSGAGGGGTGAPTGATGFEFATLLAHGVGNLDVNAFEVDVNHVKARNVRGTIAIDRGVLHFDGLEMTVFQGSLGLAGEMDYRDPSHPGFDVDVHAQDVQASDLYNYARALDRFGHLGGFLQGRLDAKAKLRGDLDSANQLDLQTFTSSGNLEMHGAELTGYPIQNALSSFLKTPQLETLKLKDWLQPFRIANGRLQFENLSLEAEKVAVSASGWQSIDGSTQMSLDLLLPQELSAGLRDQVPRELVPILFNGSGSRILVPLSLSGSIRSPVVQLNSARIGSLARDRVQQQIDENRGKIEKEIQGRAGDLLQGVLEPKKGGGGAGSDTSAVADSAGKGTKTVEEEVRGVLKNFLKKK